MIGLAAVVSVVLFVVWRVARFRRAGILAGRNAAKPVYFTAPPGRRVGDPRKETL